MRKRARPMRFLLPLIITGSFQQAWSKSHSELFISQPRSISQERLDNLRSSNLLSNPVPEYRRRLAGDTQGLCRQCIQINVHVHLSVVPLPDDKTTFFIPHPSELYDSFQNGRQPKGETASVERVKDLVRENLKLLNNVMFVNTPFAFFWNETSDVYVVGDSRLVTVDFGSTDVIRAGERWRVGDARDLNIYLSHSLCNIAKPDCDFLGAAFLPSQYADNPKRDGVFVRYSSLTNGGDPLHSRGYVLGHEIGHWMGLHHTFHVAATDTSDPCSPSNLNDFVSDTPAHTGASADLYDENCSRVDGVPGIPDTCPDYGGIDPVYNYMNYAKSEECLVGQGEFTDGQVRRMYQQWLLYRLNQDKCQANEMLLRIRVSNRPDTHKNEYSISKEDVGVLVPLWNSTTDFSGSTEKALDVDLCVPFGRYIIRILEREPGSFSGLLEVWRDGSLFGSIREGYSSLTIAVEYVPTVSHVGSTAAPTLSPTLQSLSPTQNPQVQTSMPTSLSVGKVENVFGRDSAATQACAFVLLWVSNALLFLSVN